MSKERELLWTAASLVVGGIVGYNMGLAKGTTFGQAHPVLTLPSVIPITSAPTVQGLGAVALGHPVLALCR